MRPLRPLCWLWFGALAGCSGGSTGTPIPFGPKEVSHPAEAAVTMAGTSNDRWHLHLRGAVIRHFDGKAWSTVPSPFTDVQAIVPIGPARAAILSASRLGILEAGGAFEDRTADLGIAPATHPMLRLAGSNRAVVAQTTLTASSGARTDRLFVWDGARFAEQQLGTVPRFMLGVAFAPNDLWGEEEPSCYSPGNCRAPAIAHWDGAAWDHLPTELDADARAAGHRHTYKLHVGAVVRQRFRETEQEPEYPPELNEGAGFKALPSDATFTTRNGRGISGAFVGERYVRFLISQEFDTGGMPCRFVWTATDPSASGPRVLYKTNDFYGELCRDPWSPHADTIRLDDGFLSVIGPLSYDDKTLEYSYGELLLDPKSL